MQDSKTAQEVPSQALHVISPETAPACNVLQEKGPSKLIFLCSSMFNDIPKCSFKTPRHLILHSRKRKSCLSPSEKFPAKSSTKTDNPRPAIQPFGLCFGNDCPVLTNPKTSTIKTARKYSIVLSFVALLEPAVI